MVQPSPFWLQAGWPTLTLTHSLDSNPNPNLNPTLTLTPTSKQQWSTMRQQRRAASKTRLRANAISPHSRRITKSFGRPQ